MAFQKFSRKTAGKSTEPFVTIQRRGTFSMNVAAAKLLSGGKAFDRLPVELFYDPEEKAVGLRHSTDNGPDVYYMRKQPSSESYLLSGQAFTMHFGIDTAISRRYRVTMTDDGIMTFRLTDRHVEITRSGRPPKGELSEAKATTSAFRKEVAPR